MREDALYAPYWDVWDNAAPQAARDAVQKAHDGVRAGKLWGRSWVGPRHIPYGLAVGTLRPRLSSYSVSFSLDVLLAECLPRWYPELSPKGTEEDVRRALLPWLRAPESQHTDRHWVAHWATHRMAHSWVVLSRLASIPEDNGLTLRLYEAYVPNIPPPLVEWSNPSPGDEVATWVRIAALDGRNTALGLLLHTHAPTLFPKPPGT